MPQEELSTTEQIATIKEICDKTNISPEKKRRDIVYILEGYNKAWILNLIIILFGVFVCIYALKLFSDADNYNQLVKEVYILYSLIISCGLACISCGFNQGDIVVRTKIVKSANGPHGLFVLSFAACWGMVAMDDGQISEQKVVPSSDNNLTGANSGVQMPFLSVANAGSMQHHQTDLLEELVLVNTQSVSTLTVVAGQQAVQTPQLALKPVSRPATEPASEPASKSVEEVRVYYPIGMKKMKKWAFDIQESINKLKTVGTVDVYSRGSNIRAVLNNVMKSHNNCSIRVVYFPIYESQAQQIFETLKPQAQQNNCQLNQVESLSPGSTYKAPIAIYLHAS